MYKTKDFYQDSIKSFTDSHKDIATKLIDKYGKDFSYETFLHSSLIYSITNLISCASNHKEAFEIIENTFETIKRSAEINNEK